MTEQSLLTSVASELRLVLLAASSVPRSTGPPAAVQRKAWYGVPVPASWWPTAQVPLLLLVYTVFADPGGSVRPLLLQVLRRADHGEPLHGAALQQLGGHPQRERGLAGARGRYREEVTRGGPQVAVQRLLLPGAQLVSGAPGGSTGEGRWQLRGCRDRTVGGSGTGSTRAPHEVERLVGLQDRHAGPRKRAPNTEMC